MTDEEIEHIRRVGRDEARRRTTIGLTELDALCDAALARSAPAAARGFSVEAIKQSVIAALQPAEELGGPTDAEYLALMDWLINLASGRRAATELFGRVSSAIDVAELEIRAEPPPAAPPPPCFCVPGYNCPKCSP